MLKLCIETSFNAIKLRINESGQTHMWSFCCMNMHVQCKVLRRIGWCICAEILSNSSKRKYVLCDFALVSFQVQHLISSQLLAAVGMHLRLQNQNFVFKSTFRNSYSDPQRELEEWNKSEKIHDIFQLSNSVSI